VAPAAPRPRTRRGTTRAARTAGRPRRTPASAVTPEQIEHCGRAGRAPGRGRAPRSSPSRAPFLPDRSTPDRDAAQQLADREERRVFFFFSPCATVACTRGSRGRDSPHESGDRRGSRRCWPHRPHRPPARPPDRPGKDAVEPGELAVSPDQP
jgi:hypothetical protein